MVPTYIIYSLLPNYFEDKQEKLIRPASQPKDYEPRFHDCFHRARKQKVKLINTKKGKLL